MIVKMHFKCNSYEYVNSYYRENSFCSAVWFLCFSKSVNEPLFHLPKISKIL